MENSDRGWEQAAQGAARSVVRDRVGFWDRRWLRHLDVEDRTRLIAAQVVATRPAFTAVLAGGAVILALTGVFQALGMTAGIGYPPWMVLAAALVVWVLSWANWVLRDWRLRLLVILSSMVVLGVFLSLPTPAASTQLPIRTGLFHLIPIALLVLTVRPSSTVALVATLVALTVVRLSLHGTPVSGQAMYWLYMVGTIVFGLMLSAYRMDFAVEAYRVRHVLWKQASTDSLTGLLNRAGWERDASWVHAEAGLRAASRSLVLFDVDHFKRINDSWGHERGDSVLHTLGKIIFTRLGPDSYAARLGGEEFVVLLIDATPLATERYAQRVRDEFANAMRELDCTVSAGIAFADSDETLAAHLRRADEALCAAKAAGRDRIVVAPLPQDDQVEQGQGLDLS